MDSELIEEAERLGVALECERERILKEGNSAKELVKQIRRFLTEYDLDDARVYVDYGLNLTISATVPRTESDIRDDVMGCREAAAKQEAAERRLYEELKRKFEGETK